MNSNFVYVLCVVGVCILCPAMIGLVMGVGTVLTLCFFTYKVLGG